MTNYVNSADGTRIAYDRLGEGPPVILVGGMFCARPATRPLAELLAERFSVINYDRRGRGDSDDTAPYTPDREVADLAALIEAAGGTASIYGHSSGAGLALNAAAAGLPVTRLILHEPPYGPDDEESRRDARELAEKIRTAIAEDRRADAITMFLTASGLPEAMADGMSGEPGMQAIAPTMPYDYAVMGTADTGGTIPEDRARSITAPTLVLAGDASPDFFQDTAIRLTKILPNGHHVVLAGQDHAAPPDAVAPAVTAFLADPAP